MDGTDRVLNVTVCAFRDTTDGMERQKERALRQMAYTIGEIASRAGINISTLRFYERRGLLPAPPRNVYGHRVYDSAEVSRLRFIKRAQALGFTLAEIKELLTLRESPEANCDRIRDRAEDRLQATERQIEELLEVRASLEDIVESCRRERRSDGCPAVAVLEAAPVEA